MAEDLDTCTYTKKICEKFLIHHLTDCQKKAIEAIRNGCDVFLGTKTGSGKSLTYECMPVMYENCCVVVICPLTSIMQEQCKRLNGFGFRATYIGRDASENAEIEDGSFHFIFGSPEMLVGHMKWRDLLSSPAYQQKLKLLVVDEAHTVIQWGESKGGDDAFRGWFSRIGELRSICLDVPISALTATASPTQRRKLMKKLCFKQNSVVVVDSPDRNNIKISAVKIENQSQIAETFAWLISSLQEKRESLPRHVVFCAKISECAKIYHTFLKLFGRNCKLFEMYHSQTNEGVKQHIRNNMGEDLGSIRILICTNAAGMGVNFHSVHNVVHYGLPRELDTFVQQMGRAGRDGEFSHELILYKCHKGHLKRVESELVQLVKKNSCRHKLLCDFYLFDNKEILPRHNCCDVCAGQCACGEEGCPWEHPCLSFSSQAEGGGEYFSREVNEENKRFLLKELMSLKYALDTPEAELVGGELIHGLTDSVIKDVVEKSHLLFSPDDVMKHITCWSYTLAIKIANCIGIVFGDVNSFDEEDSDDNDVDI